MEGKYGKLHRCLIFLFIQAAWSLSIGDQRKIVIMASGLLLLRLFVYEYLSTCSQVD